VKTKKILKEAAMTYFKVLYRNSGGRTEEINKILRLWRRFPAGDMDGYS
jgi:hypothetical protein